MKPIEDRFKEVMDALCTVSPEARDERTMRDKSRPFVYFRSMAVHRLYKDGYTQREIALLLNLNRLTVRSEARSISELLSSRFPDTQWIRDDYRAMCDILDGERTVRISEVKSALSDAVEERILTPQGRDIIMNRL